eukprot:14294677-Heterocapsa_arctica.AAC.1
MSTVDYSENYEQVRNALRAFYARGRFFTGEGIASPDGVNALQPAGRGDGGRKGQGRGGGPQNAGRGVGWAPQRGGAGRGNSSQSGWGQKNPTL